MRRFVLTALFILGLIGSAHAAIMSIPVYTTKQVLPPQYTYYVDSVRGSDANAGTTPYGGAFQNTTAVPALTTGQSIGLLCGSYWRQQITVSVNTATVSGYPLSCPAIAARPILDASDVVANANFTKTAGFTNVYQTPTLSFLTTGWVNVWETGASGDSGTGTYLANVSSQSLVDTTPGSYFISGMTSSGSPASAVIYIHSTDGSSPITNGYLYEYAGVRGSGLNMTSLNGKILNLQAQKSSTNNGSITLNGDGNSYSVNGALIRDGGKHNIFLPCGSSLENSTVIDGYYPGSGNLGVFFDGTGTILPFWVTDSIFQQDQNIAGNSISALFQHTITGTCGPGVVFSNWFIAKNGASFSGMSFANTNSIVLSTDYSSQLTETVTVYGNTEIVNSQFFSTITNNTAISVSANNVALALYGLSACAANVSNGMIYSPETSVIITLANSSLYLQTPSANSINMINASNGSLSVVSNNNDFGGSNSFVRPYDLAGTGNTFAGNNSIYEASGINRWTLNNTLYTTLATWLSAVAPQDAASTSSGGNAVAACTLPTIPNITMNDNAPTWERAA